MRRRPPFLQDLPVGLLGFDLLWVVFVRQVATGAFVGDLLAPQKMAPMLGAPAQALDTGDFLGNPACAPEALAFLTPLTHGAKGLLGNGRGLARSGRIDACVQAFEQEELDPAA